MSWVDNTNKSLLTVAAMNAGAKAVEQILYESGASEELIRKTAVGMGVVFNGFPDPREICDFGEMPETLPALRERVEYFVNDLSADLLRGPPATAEHESEVHMFELCAYAALKAIETHMAKKGPSPTD